MKLLFVHAHFDDFEFTAAGTFELWRRAGGPEVRRRVLVCTDGAAGHHSMSREQTSRRRIAEQEAAAQLGGFEFRLLADPTGKPFREARLQSSTAFLPALWREIREFEPDYLFCPPIPESPLAGVHVDHLDVAMAVRAVGYLINVPHAFTPEYPGEDAHLDGGAAEAVRVRTPVILNTYDGYMAGGHGHDLAVDVTDVVDHVAELAWCHASQLKEWLPWVDRHNLSVPANLEAWRPQFREVLARRKAALGITKAGLFEVFSVTAWGVVPTVEQLEKDFPALTREASNLVRLKRRLANWHSATEDSGGSEGSASESSRASRGTGVETSPEAREGVTGGDLDTVNRRLELILGGRPGFTTGAKAEMLADLLREFGRPVLLEAIAKHWATQFDTGIDDSPSVSH